jgi:Ca2+-binding RTX toxin-like protein
MCIYCGQLDRVHDFAAEGVPGPQYVGPLNDYTPPATLPTFTTDQIIQALRTSFISPVGTNTAPDPEDYTTWQNTTSWGRNGDIVYEVNTSTMSQQERGRIDLAFEVWDDAIAVNIRNDQTAGDVVSIPFIGDIPVGPTRFISVSFANSGTDAGRAYYNTTTSVQNAAANEYGTNDFTINTGVLVLGRSFNSGEFDGINSAGTPDGGVFDMTLFQQRGFETILHEAGHSLGLSHPGYYNNGQVTNAAGTRFDQDNRRNTIMSYLTEDAGNDSNADWNGLFVATPMVYDIAAVQRIYGADTQTRTGDTVYGFNNNSGRPVYDFSTTLGSVFTIWDAGGGSDTLDASQFTSDSVINLNPGSYSSIGRAGGNAGASFDGDPTDYDAMRENVGIAFNTWIERAVGGAGNDTITGNARWNELLGGAGNDTLNGGGGDDSLRGGIGNDTLNGEWSNDVLRGGDGGDWMDGGEGRDTVSYDSDNAPAGVNADLMSGKGAGGDGAIDIYVSIEELDGSSNGDELRGDGNWNTLRGLNGNDVLEGRGGDDRLKGGGGDDVLEGGAGSDYLYGGSEWGDSGIDTASYASDSSGVSINLATGIHGGAAAGDYFEGIERFVGSAHSDTMVANNNVAAHFAGGDGVDYLYGGGREDWLQGGRGADYINGGNGFDIVSYADARNAITVEMYFTDGNTDGKILAGDWGTDTLVSIEGVEGSNFDDYMIGDERGNWFHGRDGNDYIQGDQDGGPQGSFDIVFGGAGNDTVLIGANDSVSGDEGYDTATFVGGPISLDYSTSTFLVGGQRINVFTGFESYVGTGSGDAVYGAGYGETINLGAGDDHHYGFGGNDFLYTGAGADVMHGGDGFDTMVFHRAMVADWQAGVLDADIGGDSWYSWEAIQGSGGDDRIRTNSWGFAVELRGGGGNDVLATGVTGVIADRLFGEVGNDELDAGAGNDLIDGGSGDDLVAAGAGNDTLDGSDGSDTAVFTGNHSDYRIEMIADGVMLISDQRAGSPDGSDTVRAVENLMFADRTIAPVPQLGDVLWLHSDGSIAIANHDLGTLPNDWQLETTGDFDGDGDSDILCRRPDGMVVTWEMEGGQVVGEHDNDLAPAGWEIVDAGDFDADGDADVLWRHRDGLVVTWEMEDGTYVVNHNIEFASIGWSIDGMGDFDADGDSDVIWRHREGAVTMWEMEDGDYVVNHNVEFGATSWQIQGSGDFDADGDDDIVWRHTDGEVITWEMQNGNYVANNNLANQPQMRAIWQIEGIEDFDSDGDADILWRNENGAVTTWDMEGGEFQQIREFGVVTNDWQIVRTGEFDLA